MAMSENHKYALCGLGLIAAGFFVWGAKASPGASLKVPARETESLPRWTFNPPPGIPVKGVDQQGGYGYTPHRYPTACGSDLTVLIHRGYSTAALPADGDMLWMSAPPSEGEL